MTAKDLKNALLQEAVQGKLVPQIASEGNAKDLLEEIKKEKAKLIKEGKLKKEKPLPQISDDEIPFDIPENWCWCRLGEIVDTNIGLTYSPSDIVEKKGIGVLRSNNIKNGKIVYDDLVQVSKKVPEKCVANKGDLLICARNGSRSLVGKCALIEEDGMAFGAFMAIVRSRFTSYIMYFINSPVYRSKLEGVNTTTINQITQDNLRETIIPLPPLTEQKRIVAAIEQFMPLIEEYGKKEAELTALNADIAKTLKNAILQEAVQGKLAPQIASEGNAKDLLEEIKKEKAKLIKEGKLKKEKPLPEIADDEIPFDIPENWCWCRLGNVFNIITGSTPSKLSPEFYGNEIPFYKPADLDFGLGISVSSEYLSKVGYEKSRKISPNSVLVCCIGSIGKTGLIINEGTCNQQINAILNNPKINMKYVFYLINSSYMQKQMIEKASMTTLPILNKNNFSECFFPLPPFAEQNRIVEAIEKLLFLCDKLVE